MKRLIILLLGLADISPAQNPYVASNPGSYPFSSGTHNFQGTYVYIGNTNYISQNSAQLTLKAKNYIQIQPNFETSALSGQGYTHLAIDNNLLYIASFHANGFANIPQYDRFEVGLILPSNIQQQVDNFIAAGTNGPNKINPYDPDQITILCSFHGPNGAPPLYRHGFYYKDFTEDFANDTWVEQATEYKFRVRFAPPLVGHYMAHLYLVVNGSVLTASDFEFDVTQSNNRGQLSVDPNGRRKLIFDDGTIFFGIGENIPWASNDPINLNNIAPVSALPATPINHDRHRFWINDLAQNSGNFVRIRLDPWSVPIETKDYGSPSPMPLINYLNNYHHNQKSMWEMDQTLGLCEANDTKILLTLFLGEFGEDSYYGDSWSDSPYSALLGNATNAGINGFFSQTIAKDYFKKRLYYIAARWGYSTSIALWSLFNEMENMNQYTSNKSDVINWACEMKTYLHSFYPAHPVTSGIIFATSNFNDYGCLDVYEQHEYRGYSQGGIYQNDNDGLNDEAFQFWNTGKPMVYGELGYLGCTNGNPNVDQSTKVDMYNDRDFHNRLWATTMGGCLATGLNFHDWVENYVPHRANNFPALKAFMDQVDLTQNLIPNRLNPGGPNLIAGNSGKEIFNYSMETASGDYLIGWSMIGSSFWANDPPNTFNGEYPTIQACIPTAAIGYNVTSSASDPFILIPSLSQANTNYKVRFFSTYGSGGLVSTFTQQSDGNADIKIRRNLNLNDNNGANGATGPDIAYIVELGEGNDKKGDGLGFFKTGAESQNQLDEAASASVEWEQVNIYPVPVNDRVFLNWNNRNSQNSWVYIIDALGRTIEKQIQSDNSIDMHDLANGFYLLKLTDQRHEKVFKITVEH